MQIIEICLISLFGLMLSWSLVVVPILKKRNHKKQEERLNETIKLLREGDKILLSAGIRGLFVKSKGDIIHIKVDKEVILKVDKHAIVGVYK